MSSQTRKRDIILRYLRNILGGLLALPVSLVIVTAIIVIVVLLLPIIWSVIIMWWVNGFRAKLAGEPQQQVIEECECEDGKHLHA